MDYKENYEKFLIIDTHNKNFWDVREQKNIEIIIKLNGVLSYSNTIRKSVIVNDTYEKCFLTQNNHVTRDAEIYEFKHWNNGKPNIPQFLDLYERVPSFKTLKPIMVCCR